MEKKCNKPYDIVIYGASGCTGRYVVEELCNSPEIDSIKWAIAGRNRKKLQESLTVVQSFLNHGIDIQNTPILHADAQDLSSLQNMCKGTKLVLNCVGPYTLHGGETIVSTCIEYGTHLIDLCVELEHIVTTQVKYFEAAKKKEVYIVQSCGFGSLPADYGLFLMKQQFPGDLNAVEYFVKIGEGPSGKTFNTGTLLSIIPSVKDYMLIRKFDKQLKTVFKYSLPYSDYPLKRRWLFFYKRETNSVCFPYVGPDRSVLMRSQMLNYEYLSGKPVQFCGYYEFSSLKEAISLFLLMCLFLIMAFFTISQKILTKYPSFFTAGQFSNSGPSRNQVMAGTTQFTFYGSGWKQKSDLTLKPDSKIKLTLTGPEPPYPFTAMCMVQSGLVLLQETHKLPLGGGVLTPGVAFAQTTLREKLERRGMKFEFEYE